MFQIWANFIHVETTKTLTHHTTHGGRYSTGNPRIQCWTHSFHISRKCYPWFFFGIDLYSIDTFYIKNHLQSISIQLVQIQLNWRFFPHTTHTNLERLYGLFHWAIRLIHSQSTVTLEMNSIQLRFLIWNPDLSYNCSFPHNGSIYENIKTFFLLVLMLNCSDIKWQFQWTIDVDH